MKHFNRAAALLVCLFIIAAPFTGCFYSYADNVTDDWQNVTTNEELVEAFRYYCKSRDLTIEGSVADAVTSFTTQSFNNLCNGLGINVTALQAHLKKETDGNNIRFLFDSTGITAYNQIFAQFLQDNELSVGDPNVNKNVYSGEYYNGSLVWITNESSISATVPPNPNIISRGSYCKYSRSDIISKSNSNISFTFGNNTYTYYVANFSGRDAYGYTADNVIGIVNDSSYSNRIGVNEAVSGNLIREGVWNYNFIDGYPIIYRAVNGSYYYLGIYNSRVDSIQHQDREGIKRLTNITVNNNDVQKNVNINIVSNVINNNVYEGNTIINNNGTPETEPEPIPPGGTTPNWDLGGGEGTADDGNGNTWNITWPSFELPDLNIDWTINGLSEKFPFSIPFDLVALVNVLSAEPEAPQFTGTVDLKVYQWNYDLDFSQFNTVAAVFRTAETLLFVFGLIMITRKIIRG